MNTLLHSLCVTPESVKILDLYYNNYGCGWYLYTRGRPEYWGKYFAPDINGQGQQYLHQFVVASFEYPE